MDGLLRFDGREFTDFSEGLPSRLIKHILKKSNGDMFVSTDMGLVQVTGPPSAVTFKTIMLGHGCGHGFNVLVSQAYG